MHTNQTLQAVPPDKHGNSWVQITAVLFLAFVRYQQTSISKIVLSNPARWDMNLYIDQHW